MSAALLSFVLPAHNEVSNVAEMAARLRQVAAPFGAHEIVFVDGGSTDGTLAAIPALAAINGLKDQDVFLRGLVRWLGLPLATVPYVQGKRQAATRNSSCGACLTLR
jgi:GT2 family glycosyltransferase